MKTITILSTFLLILALPTICPVEAAEPQQATVESAQKISSELDDLVVKDRKIEERLSAELGEYGRPVVIISGKEMEKAGFVDLSAALQVMVPGLYTEIRSGRGGYNETSIQGSDDILWLLDGVRINDRLYGSGWEYTISVHMIDRIEVLKGGEGLFYGTGARAGVINVITKEISTEQSGQFGMSYGTDDYREVYGHATGTLNDHGLMAFGSYEGYDGYRVVDDEAYITAGNPDERKPIGFDRSTAGLKYRKAFDLAGRGVLSAQLRKQQGYFDYPYPNYKIGNTYNDWEEEIGIVKWNHDITDNFSYYLKSHFHIWEADCTFMNIDGTYNHDASPWKFEDYGVNLLTSTHFGEHELLAGVDYQNYWGKDVVVGIETTDTTEVYGLFANFRPYLPFSPDTRLALGARYNTTNENNDATVWDVSLKTPIVGQTYFRAMVGTAFTVPTALQLYGNNLANGRYGNPDLEPETSLYTQVGVGGQWSRFHFDVGYFYNDIEDMISTVYLDNGDRTYENTDGHSRIKGAEISAGIGPFAGVSLNISATWADAQESDSDQQIERIPEFYCTANAAYQHPSGRFGADLMTRYTGDKYERGLSEFDDVEYGNYFIADASVFVRFGSENQNKLTLRVENIFDKEYASRWNRTRDANDEYFLYHQYGLPRSFVLGYTYTF